MYTHCKSTVLNHAFSGLLRPISTLNGESIMDCRYCEDRQYCLDCKGKPQMTARLMKASQGCNQAQTQSKSLDTLCITTVIRMKSSLSRKGPQTRRYTRKILYTPSDRMGKATPSLNGKLSPTESK